MSESIQKVSSNPSATRLGGHCAASDVDVRVAADSPDLIATALQLDQPLLAHGRDVRGEGYEDDAAAGVARALTAGVGKGCGMSDVLLSRNFAALFSGVQPVRR